MNVGNKILGLAVGQNSILVAEVMVKGNRHAVSQCAEFVFPEGLSLSMPDKMGEAFHKFLREKNIYTKDVVIGLPAKRLVTRRKEVPPATVAVAASTLRLQAEGEFSSELDNLIMDFAGTPSLAGPTTVLIIATNKVVVDECEAMARAAGLRVHAITSTTAALGRATSRLPGGDGLVLSIGPIGAELVIQHGADPAHLKHLNVVGGMDSIIALAGEIRRVMAAIPRNGTPQTLALWNSGMVEDPRSLLEQRLGIPVNSPVLSNMVVIDAPNSEGFAPAVALALTALDPAGLPVDFLHSRMAPPRVAGMSDQKKLAVAGILLAASVAAFVFMDISSKQRDVNLLNSSISKKTQELAVATAQINKLEFARKWLPKGPHNIEVLRDVTVLVYQFASGRNTIWATSFGNNRDIFTWEIDGKSSNETYPQTLVDRMRGNSRFTNPKLNNLQYEAQTGLWSFRMSFTYKPEEGISPGMAMASGMYPAPAPAPAATTPATARSAATTRAATTPATTTRLPTRGTGA